MINLPCMELIMKKFPKNCYLCPDHVISAGRQMKNLVLNFEYLLLLSFLIMAEF